MSLHKQAEAALRHLVAPQTITAQEGGRRLTCELTALDTLACAFTRLEVAADGLAGASERALRKISDTLSKRLTYLLEPIAPVEIDPEQCVVQMRSNPPQRDEDRSSYYELLVARGGHISLCRYAKQRGGPRDLVPAHVTREVLLRLIGDIEGVAP
jgi:hypothetical protein